MGVLSFQAVRLSLALAASVWLSLVPGRGAGCEIALLLAVDVSNSVDSREYLIQTRGIAAALRDPQVAEALIQGRSAVAVMQWSGPGKQDFSVPWTRVESAAGLAALAAQIDQMPRALFGSNTALGNAMAAAQAAFGPMGDCNRWVIDVSGDGAENAGTDVAAARRSAERRGITVNGLAIEGLGLAISGYYRNTVKTRDGFVETARGFGDFPRAIRAKIRREVSRLTG